MPIVTSCTAPGCEVLTIGPLCIEHDVEPRSAASLRRGRPFPSDAVVGSDVADQPAVEREAPRLLDHGQRFTRA